jgi:ectoine hydroxylase
MDALADLDRDGFVVLPDALEAEELRRTAVVFDRRPWHARGDNTSAATRRVLFLARTYRWIRLRDDPTLDAAVLARLTPVRRQLAGGSTGVLGHWFPTCDDAPLRAHVEAMR